MQEQVSIYPLGCEPFCTDGKAIWDGESYMVELYPGSGMENPLCPSCHCRMHIQNTYTKRLRTLPVGQYIDSYWDVHYRRFRCPCCRRSAYDDIPFQFVGNGNSGTKITTMLARTVWRLLDGTSISKVAQTYHLRWNTVKEIELFYMKRALEAAGLPLDIRYLGIDEVHIGHVRRKHHYITIISSLEDRRPIWICDGKSIEAVMPFFQWFGMERLAKVKAVSMDANAGYASAFRKGCPNAVPVLDHFHLIEDFGRDCLGKIRIRLWHGYEETDKRLARKFKDSLWTSLSREENLSEKATAYLAELRNASKDYDNAIICLYRLRKIYEENSCSRSMMAKAWDEWVALAMATEVPEIVAFAQRRNMPLSRSSILNYVDHRISNGPVEGMNNRIGNIIRMAYGLRDLDYLFTKIKYVFLPPECRRMYSEYRGDSERKPNGWRPEENASDSVP